MNRAVLIGEYCCIFDAADVIIIIIIDEGMRARRRRIEVTKRVTQLIEWTAKYIAHLERRLAVMLVDDAEGADLGADGADLGRHVDDQLVLVDEAVVACVVAAPRRHIQTGHCDTEM